MAYRSFKRVLVETSLERKCLVLFGVALFLLIAGGFWYAERNAEELVEERTQATGRDFIEFKLVLRHVQPFVEKAGYTPSEAGVLDELGSHLQSRDYGWELITTEPDRCTQEAQLDGAREPKPGEVAIIQRLLERFETQFTEDVESDLLDDTVNVGSGAELVPTPADVAQTMTSSLVSGIEPVSEFDPKGSHYHYYQPVYWRESCAICHGFTKLADDDRPMALQGPRAIIKVAIPAEETQSSIRASRGILLATAIMTVFLSMVALYLVVRLIIIRPLNHLRDVSEEISRGNTTLRADIQTNDEFEDLGASFNRMLRHLVDTQEELRKVNTDLDGKVDQLAQANMQLHEMNRVKSDFLANMSHELRTPLNSIIGFSDVLKRIQTLDNKQKRYVENIGRSGRILLEMINDILDLAKMESGKMDLRLTEFDIVRVITAQCDLVRALSEEKNIDLLMQLPEGLPLMFQDQSKVQQILTNLLSNAIKFTPEGGRIVVSAICDDETLELSVEDTGVGIAEEDRNVIFEKFRQGTVGLGQSTLTREYSGTGLGLSIVKELCKLLGGEVSFESQVGKGSTFTIRIPWQLSADAEIAADLAKRLNTVTSLRPDLFTESFASDSPNNNRDEADQASVNADGNSNTAS